MKKILQIFQEETQYNIEKYFLQIDEFLRVNYPKIIEFYSAQNNLETNVKDSFQLLKNLMDESDTLLAIIKNYQQSLDSRFWEIVELVDDIKLNLGYIENTPKWLRSSLNKGRYSYSFENNELLRQRETLELMVKRLGSSDKEDDWHRIALRNDLSEEGYTVDGGVDLVIQYFNRLSSTLVSVVDSNLVGEKVYGIDVNCELTYLDDDLEALTYKKTIEQAVGILVGLRQGDNPQYLENGIQSSLITGANKNSIPYSILVRQLYSTFQNDDTLKSLKIIELENKTDSLTLTLEVETRISEIIQENILL